MAMCSASFTAVHRFIFTAGCSVVNASAVLSATAAAAALCWATSVPAAAAMLRSCCSRLPDASGGRPRRTSAAAPVASAIGTAASGRSRAGKLQRRSQGFCGRSHRSGDAPTTWPCWWAALKREGCACGGSSGRWVTAARRGLAARSIAIPDHAHCEQGRCERCDSQWRVLSCSGGMGAGQQPVPSNYRLTLDLRQLPAVRRGRAEPTRLGLCRSFALRSPSGRSSLRV